MTDESPAIAPSLMREDIHPNPAWSAATAIGSGTFSSLYEITPVAMPDTRMYSTVQISSEPMMPIGMSFCGFFASCAAVLTASNPMYAKNTRPAPAITPVQPNAPRSPVLGGMKGCQLAGFTARTAATIKSRTTATLMKTMTLLTFADSLMPITSRVVTIAMMITAGRLNTAGVVHCGATTPRAAAREQGTSMPTSLKKLTT